MERSFGRNRGESGRAGNAAERSRENSSEARQQRKIIAAFERGGWKSADASVLNMWDIELREGAREEFLHRIRTGGITSAEERGLLSRIMSPVQSYGYEEVFNSLNVEGKSILGRLVDSSGVSGAEDMEKFFKQYPWPLDFEIANAGHLVMIEFLQGKRERGRQEILAQSFGKTVYGKRWEYWEQLKALNAEARDREEASELRQKYWGQTSGGQFRNVGRGALFGASTPGEGAENRFNFEWGPMARGVRQVSRRQVRFGLVNAEPVGGDCQDSILVRDDQQLFGVFDGMGGSANGAAASRMASESVNDVCGEYILLNGEHLSWALQQANDKVFRAFGGAEKGGTTAVLAKITKKEDGHSQLSFASVGDSRIYVVKPGGEVKMVTEDEGFRNRIWNCLGNKDMEVRQFGDIELEPGSRLVLCSDGITGDEGVDLMSDETIGRIVKESRNAQEAANKLLETASKLDDRTVIVVGT